MKAEDVMSIEHEVPQVIGLVPGTKEDKQSFFLERHRLRIPKTNHDVMWTRLVDVLGPVGALEAVFDLVLNQSKPRTIEVLRDALRGNLWDPKVSDPAILDSLFFQNGNPRKLGRLLLDHASSAPSPLKQLRKPDRPSEPREAQPPATPADGLEWFDRQTRYKVGDRIGDGGMGIVYRGIDSRLGSDVAIKIIRRDHRKDEEFVARFDREVRAQSRLRHPNVLAIIDRGRDFYVAELCETSLDRRVRASRLSADEAISIIVQCCNGLAEAHRAGVIHRDVKPQNILLDHHGTVKVADFGLCKIVSSEIATMTSTGAAMGTARYTAPEQWRDAKRADARSDIYSLGHVLLECANGDSNLAVRSTLPAGLTDIIRRATSADPADRYASIDEFRSALIKLSSRGASTG